MFVCTSVFFSFSPSSLLPPPLCLSSFPPPPPPPSPPPRPQQGHSCLLASRTEYLSEIPSGLLSLGPWGHLPFYSLPCAAWQWPKGKYQQHLHCSADAWFACEMRGGCWPVAHVNYTAEGRAVVSSTQQVSCRAWSQDCRSRYLRFCTPRYWKYCTILPSVPTVGLSLLWPGA